MKLTMKKWKVAIFSIVLLFIAALSTLLWNVRTPSVIGSAATASDYGLTMENGASIRIVGTSGIRFSASISEEKAANATEYGMILSTAEALNGAELTKENAKRTIKSTAGMNTATEGGNIRFNAVLTNVKDENLTRTYVARAYVTDANGTYYTDAVERTPFGVAVAAYADYKDKPGYDAIKDYIVLDVNIDGEGNVTLAREYATIAGVTISASGTVNVSDPNLSDIIGEGTEFFGLVVNGKRVEMGENSSVVEIGGKDFEFTNVSVSGGTFSGTSTAHTHSYVWNTSAAEVDVKSCTCGAIAETFTKDYTSNRLELVYGKGETTITLPVAVTSPLLDGADESLTVSGTSVDFSSLKDNLQKHGDHTLTGTVTTEDGQEHTVKLAVRLITGDIDRVVTMFNAVFAKDGEEKWGFYRVTKDFDYRNYFINQDCGYNMDSAEDTTARAGFHGTIYGEKADGTRPVITSQQRSNGVFGWLLGATVKDLIIVDEYAAGVHPYSGALLAVVAQSSTISNVEFRLTTAAGYTSDEQENQRKGWIVNRYCAWNTFENVSIVNVSPSVTTFAPLFGTGNSGDYTGMEPNTFKNCIVSGAEISSLGWQINSTTGEKTIYTLDNTSGITATDHIHNYVLVSDASGHSRRCTVCGATTGRENHSGGTANCAHGKICTVCDVEYTAPFGNHVGGEANCAHGKICTVCGVEYTAPSGEHVGPYNWTVGENADEKICTVCGKAVETFTTNYTTRYDVDQYANETLNLSGYFTNATVSNIAFNDVALSGDISAISFANVTDLSKHGDHELTMMVEKDGQAHSVKFAVRLITRTFTEENKTAMAGLVRGNQATSKIYGFYRIAEDINIQYSAGFGDIYNEDANAELYGFAGTIYGEKADGTAPVVSVVRHWGGNFGTLLGATIENIIFADGDYYGSAEGAGQGYPLIADYAKNTTFKDVTFRAVYADGGKGVTQATTGWAYGWLTSKDSTGAKFINVNFESQVEGLELGLIFNSGKITFENCYIMGFAGDTHIIGNGPYATATAEGVSTADHVHTYTYTGTAEGHVGTCTVCKATTATAAHFGGVATCQSAGKCKLCGYEYIPASVGTHSFDSTTYVSNGEYHYIACKYCGMVDNNTVEAHRGGTATCAQGAICDVCGVEYTAPFGEHVGPYNWTVGENADEKYCTICNAVVETFTTNYTTRYDVDQYANETLNLSGYFTNATVSDIAFNGVALSGDIGAISFANVTDLSKHGDHELTMTVEKDGQAHSVKFAVRLITRSFGNNATDIAAMGTLVRGVKNETKTSLYGFYRVTEDLECAYKYSELWNDAVADEDKYGFAGTLYGEKADGSIPELYCTAQFGGLFGNLVGATIKDLIIKDGDFVGTPDQWKHLIAFYTYDTTFENVTFRITNISSNYKKDDQKTAVYGLGWIIGKDATGAKFINVNFESQVAGAVVGRLIGSGTPTFENCYVVGFDEVKVIYGSSITATGVTTADHVHTYTYTGTAEGHVGTCTQCDATTATAAHFGGVATCQSAGKCKLCGYEYIPASVGSHSFDGTTYVSDDEYHYLACKYCGTVDGNTAEAHTGGTATCAQGAICEVCGVEYGAVSSTGHEAFAWRTGEHVDEKYCTTCNAVVETFVTDYTATRYDIDQYAEETLNLSKYFASASNIAFNGVALSGNIGAISFANVTDLSKHGDHELTMTVTEDGQAHNVKFAVRLITRSFGNNATDIAAMGTLVRGVKNETKTSLYGFYRVTEDLECAYKYSELWNDAVADADKYGFAGTLYGEKADGGIPELYCTAQFGGLFGNLVGATIKDLIIKDGDFVGTPDQWKHLIAFYTYDTTFENVTFRITNISSNYNKDAQQTAVYGLGWIIGKDATGAKFINVNFESQVAGAVVGRLIGSGTPTFENCYVMGFDEVKVIYGSSITATGVSTPKNVIVVGNPDGENAPSDYLTEVAFDLQDLLQKATGVTWAVQRGGAYSTSNSYVNKIILGNVTALADSATLTAAAKGKGGSSYAMKADGTTLYLCGANDYGIEFAVYEFLEQYFGFEMFSPTYYVMNTETWTNESTLDATKIATSYADGVQMAFLNNSYRTVLSGDSIQQMRYSGDIGVEQLMYVKEGDYSSKVHNAFSWLDPATYKGQHASWYAKEEYKNWLGITKTRQAYYELCYTAQGNTSEYNAMIAQCVEVVKTAVALPANANLHYLPFLKNDATSVCVCDACKNLANAHGGNKSATVVKFMNDLMAAIKADTSITRTDFDLVFFAYEGFETAPTGMTLDDRVTVWLAAPYSFNYQASIDDSTNAAGKANLKAWSDMSTSGDLWLWTYSTKFTDFLFPVDTFAFYNETAYNYFKECGVTMVYNQAQDSQTGRLTAWHELKMYLEGQLMQDSTKTQAELIAHYMEKTFGPAAEAMTNFFNGVRTASQADSLKTLYANNKYGAYTLLGNAVILRNNGSCWNKSDIQSWLNYCTQAYAAIDAAKTAGTISDTEYARIKANIDTEWASPAYMYLCFYGAGDGVTKAGLISKINALGITRFSEFNTQGGGLVSSSDPEVSLEAHINGL